MIIRIKKSKDIWVMLCLTIYMFNMLFKYFMPNAVTKLLPITALLIAGLFKLSGSRLNIKVNKSDKFFLAFLIYWFLGITYSPDMVKGLGYVLSFAVAYVIYLLICEKNLSERGIMRFISTVCTIFAMFVIIQPLFPQIVSRVNSLFSYTSLEYNNMASWARNGWYSGLFPDRAPAAFYSAMLTGAGVYYLLLSKYVKSKTRTKLLGAILFIVGLYAILMTSKRGLLVGTAIASLAMYIIYKKVNKMPVWKIVILVVIGGTVGVVAFLNLEGAQTILKRFTEKADFFTGRLDIYDNILKVAANNILFGTGTGSADYILGVGGHNIYLTVLMENGLVGIILFISAVVYVLINSIYNAVKIEKEKEKQVQKLPFLMFSIFVQFFFCVYGFTGNPLYDNYIIYFYIIAILINRNTISRRDG